MQTADLPGGHETKRWYHRVGPGLITACVVIGPGSILTSSRVGAAYGYHMSWVVVVSVAFMLVYMTLGAKLGVVSGESMGRIVRELWPFLLAQLAVLLLLTLVPGLSVSLPHALGYAK